MLSNMPCGLLILYFLFPKTLQITHEFHFDRRCCHFHPTKQN